MLEVGKVLSNEEVIDLVGTEKQKEQYKLKKTFKGNTKSAVLKNLSSICKFEEIKVGRKSSYKIIEVYDEKKEVKDNRINNGASKIKFTEHLETALALAILKESKKEFSDTDMDIKGYDYDMPYFTITNTNLMFAVGLANATYCDYKNKKEAYAEEVGNYKQSTVDIAFDKVKNLSKNMHSALNRLSNSHKLITCTECLVAKGMKTESIIVGDRKYTSEYEFVDVWVKGSEDYNKVKQNEKAVLNEMGVSSLEAIKRNKIKTSKYERLLAKRLNEEMGINRIFYTNKITIMKVEWLEKFISEREDLDISRIINSMSAYNILVENLKNRTKGNLQNRIDKKLKAINKNSIQEKDGFDISEEYQSKLIKEALDLAIHEIEEEDNTEIKIYNDLVNIVVNDEDIINLAKEKCYKQKNK